MRRQLAVVACVLLVVVALCVGFLTAAGKRLALYDQTLSSFEESFPMLQHSWVSGGETVTVVTRRDEVATEAEFFALHKQRLTEARARWPRD